MKSSMLERGIKIVPGTTAEPTRTKTLPFPAPSGRDHKDDDVGMNETPLLVELDREHTWRFIAPRPPAPAQNDCDYTVELIDGDDRQN